MISRVVRIVLVIALVTIGSVAPIVSDRSAGALSKAPAPIFQRFTSCDRLLAYLRAETLPYIGPYGIGGPQVYPNAIPAARIDPRGRKVPVKATTAITTTATRSVATIAATATAVAFPTSAAVPSNTIVAAAGPAVDIVTGPNGVTPAAASSSQTNVQEAAVDEGDLVENDGRYVYTSIDTQLRVVDTEGGGQVAALPLVGGRGAGPFTDDLLLDGNRLAVIQHLFSSIGPESAVSVYDVSSPTAPRLLGRTHLEGQAIATRSIDHRARIVMQTSFGQRLGFATPINALRSRSAWDAAGRANEQIVRTAPPAAWLPRTYTEDANGVASEPKAALSCAEVGRPAEFAGFGFTWVASVDLDRPNANIEADGAAAVVGAGGAVYASSRNLYVTTPVWQNTISPGRVNVTINRVPRSETVIHAFDMTPADGAAYLASGRIPGVLLNQYSMSERNGYLRVATTVNDAGFGATNESQLRILRRDGSSLQLVSSLGGLGRNERIYAVRFVDDLGYVVTFRQTDPLYVLDLRDPLAPRLAGQLSIPGYSAYLYPIGNGQLLGLGQDATTEGRIQGTQISLFDVRDPYNPARVTNLAFPGGRSEGEADPHAFLWWAPTRSVVIPLFQPANGPNQPTFLGAVVTTIDAATITEKGRIAHFAIAPSGQLTQLAMLRPEPIRRSMIVADRLVTVSWLGVKLNSVAALQELGWMPFSH